MVAVAHTETLIHTSSNGGDDVENLDLKTSIPTFGGLVPVVAGNPKKLNRYHQHIELAVDSDQTDSILRRQQQNQHNFAEDNSPPSSTRSPSSEDIYEEDEDEEIIRVDQIVDESEQATTVTKEEEEEKIEDLNDQLTPPASTEQEDKEEEEEEEEDRLVVMDEMNGDLKIADEAPLGITSKENRFIQGQVKSIYFSPF